MNITDKKICQRRLHRSHSFSKMPDEGSLCENTDKKFKILHKKQMEHVYKEGWVSIILRPKKHTLFTPLKKKYWAYSSSTDKELLLFRDSTKLRKVYTLSLCGARIEFVPTKTKVVTDECFCIVVKAWRKKETIHFNDVRFIVFDTQENITKWIQFLGIVIKAASNHEVPEYLLEHSKQMGAVDSIIAEADTDSDADIHSVHSDEYSEDMFDKFAIRQDPIRILSPYLDVAVSPSLHPARRSAPLNSPRTLRERRNSLLGRAKTKINSSKRKFASTPTNTKKMMQKPKLYGMSSAMAIKKVMTNSKTNLTRIIRPNEEFRLKATQKINDSDMETMASSERIDSNATSVEEEKLAAQVPSALDTHPIVVAATKVLKHCTAYLSSIDGRIYSAALLLINIFFGWQHASYALPLALAGLNAYIQSVTMSIAYTHPYERCGTAYFGVFCIAKLINVGSALLVCALIVFTWRQNDVREAGRRQRQLFVEKLKQNDLSAFKSFEMPSWILDPDVIRVDWLNNILRLWWPFLGEAITESLIYLLNPILETSKPSYVASMYFRHMDFGSSYPIIESVKLLPSNAKDNKIEMDLEVLYEASADQMAEIKLTSTMGIAAKIRLRDLSISGTLRLSFNPLCTTWPCFSAISLSFIRKPNIQFSLTAAKLNVTSMPFVSDWLRMFLQHTLVEYIVWPHELTIPIWEQETDSFLSVSPNPPPTTPSSKHTLQLQLHKASNISTKDNPLPNSYIALYLLHGTTPVSNKKTSAIQWQTNSPVWNESLLFEFESHVKCSVRLEIWFRSRHSTNDKLIGYDELELPPLEQMKQWQARVGTATCQVTLLRELAVTTS